MQPERRKTMMLLLLLPVKRWRVLYSSILKWEWNCFHFKNNNENRLHIYAYINKYIDQSQGFTRYGTSFLSLPLCLCVCVCQRVCLRLVWFAAFYFIFSFSFYHFKSVSACIRLQAYCTNDNIDDDERHCDCTQMMNTLLLWLSVCCWHVTPRRQSRPEQASKKWRKKKRIKQSTSIPNASGTSMCQLATQQCASFSYGAQIKAGA